MEQLQDTPEWEYGALTDHVLKSGDAMLIVDPGGVVLFANSGAGEIVGIPTEAMTGHTVEDFGREAMHDFQRVAVAFAAGPAERLGDVRPREPERRDVRAPSDDPHGVVPHQSVS